LAKIREAKAALEAEAKAAADAKQKEREAKEAAAVGKLPGRKPKIDPTPKPTAQRGFTDPDSRIMKGGDGAFIQGYNGQVAVDADHQIIVACALTQQAGDVGHAVAMVEQTIEQTGFIPSKVMADGGYFSEENMTALDDLGTVALIPPDRERCGTPDNPAIPLSPEELAALTPINQMRHRVSTKEGRESYARRKTIVEPVFGQIKGSAGNPGFTGFLRRGLEKCTNEWHLVCATHNILKYIRFISQNNGQAASKKVRKQRISEATNQFQTAMAV